MCTLSSRCWNSERFLLSRLQVRQRQISYTAASRTFAASDKRSEGFAECLVPNLPGTCNFSAGTHRFTRLLSAEQYFVQYYNNVEKNQRYCARIDIRKVHSSISEALTPHDRPDRTDEIDKPSFDAWPLLIASKGRLCRVLLELCLLDCRMRPAD